MDVKISGVVDCCEGKAIRRRRMKGFLPLPTRSFIYSSLETVSELDCCDMEHASCSYYLLQNQIQSIAFYCIVA
jgi:hypothetical protein